MYAKYLDISDCTHVIDTLQHATQRHISCVPARLSHWFVAIPCGAVSASTRTARAVWR